MQRRDGRDDEIGPQPAVILTLVAAEVLKLRLRGGYQQLEEKLAAAISQPVAQPREPLGLAAIQVRVAVRVVADKHFGECRIEGLDVGAEVLAVLEFELLLARPLHRHG